MSLEYYTRQKNLMGQVENPKCWYLGPQGSVGPHTEPTASAFNMQSNYTARYFTENGPLRLLPAGGCLLPATTGKGADCFTTQHNDVSQVCDRLT